MAKMWIPVCLARRASLMVSIGTLERPSVSTIAMWGIPGLAPCVSCKPDIVVTLFFFTNIFGGHQFFFSWATDTPFLTIGGSREREGRQWQSALRTNFFLFIQFSGNFDQTSMHSSRMHTTCLLPVSPNMHCSQMWKEFLTHASENITLPQLHCGR